MSETVQRQSALLKKLAEAEAVLRNKELRNARLLEQLWLRRKLNTFTRKGLHTLENLMNQLAELSAHKESAMDFEMEVHCDGRHGNLSSTTESFSKSVLVLPVGSTKRIDSTEYSIKMCVKELSKSIMDSVRSSGDLEIDGNSLYSIERFEQNGDQFLWNIRESLHNSEAVYFAIPALIESICNWMAEKVLEIEQQRQNVQEGTACQELAEFMKRKLKELQEEHIDLFVEKESYLNQSVLERRKFESLICKFGSNSRVYSNLIVSEAMKEIIEGLRADSKNGIVAENPSEHKENLLRTTCTFQELHKISCSLIQSIKILQDSLFQRISLPMEIMSKSDCDTRERLNELERKVELLKDHIKAIEQHNYSFAQDAIIQNRNNIFFLEFFK